jgi:protein-S-isoprenylcysteine O-methyltransferase Ste14
VAENAAARIVGGTGGTVAQPASGTHELEHFSGRRISWIGVIVTCVGFIVGGVSFFLHPVAWWLFWTGAGVAVVGLIILLSAKTFSEDWY